MHQSGRPVWGWRETLALPRPQKIIRPAHTPLKSDFYNKIGHYRNINGRNFALRTAFVPNQTFSHTVKRVYLQV